MAEPNLATNCFWVATATFVEVGVSVRVGLYSAGVSVMKETGIARRTGRGWTRASLAVGVLAVVSYAIGYLAVAHLWRGDPLVIGIATALQYVLPLAGIVVGHVARRREGPRRESTGGLVLSYLLLAVAVVPVVIGSFGLLLAR